MIAFLPFALQGLIMMVDEFYFHRRRTLRRWERVGHPLDTLFFLFCLGFTLVISPTPGAVWIYSILAVANCLFITKDEWQHRELCKASENWLHALLFILHPVLLIWTGYLWIGHADWFRLVVGSAMSLSLGFMLYQITYWNFYRHD